MQRESKELPKLEGLAVEAIWRFIGDNQIILTWLSGIMIAGTGATWRIVKLLAERERRIVKLLAEWEALKSATERQQTPQQLPDSEAGPSAARVEIASAHNAIVHVIDDDPAIRQSVAFTLTSSGFAIKVYNSAIAFLAGIRTVEPGCILTDVTMPGMSGVELLRQLKARQIRLPVIVMTGDGETQVAVDAMKAGAVEFIEKPFTEEALIFAVRTALEFSEENERWKGEVSVIGVKPTVTLGR